MRPRFLTSIPVLAAAVALLLAPRVASPLPLYSRTLGVPCSTCHDVAPHLNAVGLAFLQRGHMLDAHGTETAARPGGIPLSAVGSAGLTDVRTEPVHDAGGASARDTDAGSFSSFELVAAGSPTSSLYGRFEAGLTRAGVDVDRGDEYVQVSDLRRSGMLAFRVGRFDAELPFLSSDRRLTMTRYLSPIAFTARGFELNGAHANWAAAAGLSLSDRTFAGGVHPHTIASPLEDTYLQLRRRFGAQAVGAQMLFDRQDSHLSTLSWLQHMRCQLAAQLAVPGVTFVPSYVFDRFDDRPMPGVHERHQYYMLESIVPLGLASRWTMTARYEHDYRTRNNYDPEEHRQQAALQLAWQAIPNARLGVECAAADDRLAHQANTDLEAFAQASW